MTMIDTSIPEAPATPLAPGDFVQLRNVGPHPLLFLWDSKKYRLDPGQQMPVPFELAKLYLGDPRSGPSMASIRDFRGIVHWIPDRASEIRRLRCLYDNQTGDESTVVGFPQVRVFDLEGKPVITVLDDPSGETTTPVNQSVADNNEIMAIIQRQQATIDMLLQRLDTTNSGEPVVPDDSSETPPMTAEEINAALADSLDQGPDAATMADPFASELDPELPEDSGTGG